MSFLLADKQKQAGHQQLGSRRYGSNKKKSNSDKYEEARRAFSCRQNAVWLYHQTDPDAATAILASQRMLRGCSGLVGGGIYFAETAQESNAKCHHDGVVLLCHVRLGIQRSVDHGANKRSGCYPNFTWTELTRDGYDSVMITNHRTGNEHVVFNYEQVEEIQWHSGVDVRERVQTFARDNKAVSFNFFISIFIIILELSFIVLLTFTLILCNFAYEYNGRVVGSKRTSSRRNVSKISKIRK